MGQKSCHESSAWLTHKGKSDSPWLFELCECFYPLQCVFEEASQAARHTQAFSLFACRPYSFHTDQAWQLFVKFKSLCNICLSNIFKHRKKNRVKEVKTAVINSYPWRSNKLLQSCFHTSNLSQRSLFLPCSQCLPFYPSVQTTFETIFTLPGTRIQEWQRTACRDMHYRRVAGHIQCAPSCKTAGAQQVASAPPSLKGTSTCQKNP